MKEKRLRKDPRTEKMYKVERPISDVYPAIDNDLARDNLENTLPAADREDLD